MACELSVFDIDELVIVAVISLLEIFGGLNRQFLVWCPENKNVFRGFSSESVRVTAI